MRRSTEGGDRESRGSSPRFQQKIFHQHFFSVALFTAKVDKSVLSALHKKKIIKIESELRSVAPGGGSALRASATVFREEIRKKKGKSDTLVVLGVSVCQSVKCVRGEKPAARTHTPSLPS